MTLPLQDASGTALAWNGEDYVAAETAAAAELGKPADKEEEKARDSDQYLVSSGRWNWTMQLFYIGNVFFLCLS